MTDTADAARVIAWATETPRRPANLAFTEGPERQAAYWVEWAEQRERQRCAPLMQAVEWLLDDGHMSQEHLARLRAAYEHS